MPINYEFDPNNPTVIDSYLSSIFEMESHNYYSNQYAMEVVRHYFLSRDLDNDFDPKYTPQLKAGFDSWYSDWIGTEEFRGQRYPDGTKFGKKTLRRFEKMYDLYWDARAEWFNTMIAQLNMQNIREANRNYVMHTMCKSQSWEEFGKAAQKPQNRIDHLMKDDD